ncbi:MAG: DUF6794 domain-containing protein [Balneola sp.]
MFKNQSKYYLFLFFLFFSSIICAQSNDQRKDDSNSSLTIPKNIEEAHHQLDSLLSDEDIVEIKNLPSSDSTIKYHLGFGMWLRNNWGLWSGSDLYLWFYERGYSHPDNISATILETYWNYLNGQPYQINERFGSEWEEIQLIGAKNQEREILASTLFDYMETLISGDSLNIDSFQKLVSLHSLMLEMEYDFYYPFEDEELKGLKSRIITESLDNELVMRNMLQLAAQDELEIVNLFGLWWEDEILKVFLDKPIQFSNAYAGLSRTQRNSIATLLAWHYDEHIESISKAFERIEDFGLIRIVDDLKERIQTAKESYEK